MASRLHRTCIARLIVSASVRLRPRQVDGMSITAIRAWAQTGQVKAHTAEWLGPRAACGSASARQSLARSRRPAGSPCRYH
jgi:hypothetical protein